MRDYTGQVVWITGASSGIGEALAYAFAQAGAKLVLSARRSDLLDAVRSRCARPDAHLVLPFDMTHVADHATHVASVIAHFGHVDLLINNAGISQRSLAQETQLSVDRQLFETDYFGPISLVKSVLPHMLTRGQGQLAVISSVAGLVATPMRSSYSAAKAAVIAFHDSLRVELHNTGIHVSVLCPGFVATQVAESALTGDGTASGNRFSQPKDSMSPESFAKKAIAALAREQDIAVIGGRERLLWWIARTSPWAAGQVLRRVKVV